MDLVDPGIAWNTRHPMSGKTNRGQVDCGKCVHFREAPYQARLTGCYFPDNMESKQDAAYLDQQQTPGSHEKINILGDCKDFEMREAQPSWWQRLWSVGA